MTTQTEALAQPEQEMVSKARYNRMRDDYNKSAFTISAFPKTKAKKRVDLAPTDFHVFSKAGTSNVTPKGKKK